MRIQKLLLIFNTCTLKFTSQTTLKWLGFIFLHFLHNEHLFDLCIFVLGFSTLLSFLSNAFLSPIVQSTQLHPTLNRILCYFCF